MVLLNRSARRGMIAGAAISSSRAKKRAPAQAQMPAASSMAPPSTQPDSTDQTVEQIKKFAELKSQGILTDEEFEAKKKQLLGL